MRERGKPPPGSPVELANLWQQDDEVAALVRRLASAIRTGESENALEVATGLENYVHEHLQLEEDIYFPAAEKLSPDNVDVLRTIRLAHLAIRSDLREISEALEKGHLGVARTQLSSFLENFRSHERAEDQIIAVLSKN